MDFYYDSVCSMSDAIICAKLGRKIREYTTVSHDMVWDNDKNDLVRISKTDPHDKHCGVRREFRVQQSAKIMRYVVSYLDENKKYFLLEDYTYYPEPMIHLLINKEEYDKLEINSGELHPLDPFPNIERKWSIELTNDGIYKYRREDLYHPDDPRYHPQDVKIFREKISDLIK